MPGAFFRKMWSTWKHWLGGEARREVHIVVYSREHCSLCVKAWDLLCRIQREFGFRLEKRAIDRDPALLAEHGSSIPVVTIDGKVRFRGQVNEVLLRRMLTAPAEVDQKADRA